MFSVVFPGQGSQKLGMAKEFFEKFELVKKLFHEADEILNLPIFSLLKNLNRFSAFSFNFLL